MRHIAFYAVVLLLSGCNAPQVSSETITSIQDQNILVEESNSVLSEGVIPVRLGEDPTDSVQQECIAGVLISASEDGMRMEFFALCFGNEDGSEISPVLAEGLNDLVRRMNESRAIGFSLVHFKNTRNLTLAEERKRRVCDFFVNAGIDRRRITIPELPPSEEWQNFEEEKNGRSF